MADVLLTPGEKRGRVFEKNRKRRKKCALDSVDKYLA